MPIQIKTASGYKLVYNVWQKQAGEWKLVPSIWYKALDEWKVVHVNRDSFVFNAVISSNVVNYNMREKAILAGWDEVAPIIATVTINSGVIVSSVSIGSYAFATGTVFPDGSSLTLTNNGTILGRGGVGGAGGSNAVTPTNGASGGPALLVSLPCLLYNYGRIAGGGGGGGGGRGWSYGYDNFGGGGGGGGIGIAVGGARGSVTSSNSYYVAAQAGATSTTTTAGAGGAGGYDVEAYADRGGVGGGYGSNGNLATNGYAGAYGSYSPRLTKGAVGVAGAALSGNSNITYAVTGTINGATL